MTMTYIVTKSDKVAISFTKFKSTEGINDMVPKQQRNNLLSPYQNSQMSIIWQGQKNYYEDYKWLATLYTSSHNQLKDWYLKIPQDPQVDCEKIVETVAFHL